MAFRRPLKFEVNTNSTKSGGDHEFKLMTNDDISRLRQRAIFELGKDPVYKLLVTLQNDSDRLDPISDTRVRSGPGLDGTNSSYPTSDDVLSTVNTDYQRLRDSTDSCGFDSNAYLYLADTAPRPLCLDSDRGQIVMQMPLQDVFDTLIKPALDSIYSDVTNVNDSDASMRPGLFYIGTTAANTVTVDGRTVGVVESADAVFIDTVANVGSFDANAIGTTGTFQDHPQTATTYRLFSTHNDDSNTEHFIHDTTTDNVAVPLYFETNAQKGYGHPGLRQFSRNQLHDYLRRAVRYVAGGETNYRQSYIIDSGATGNIMGVGMVNTEIANPTPNFQVRLADPGATDPNDYRGQEFPTGTPAAVNTMYLKFVRH